MEAALPTGPLAAALPLLAVTATIAWWGWERGAYFGVTFLPGGMVLLLLLASMLLFAPWPAALGGAPRVALTALVALGAWTLVSAVWSPAPDIAVDDAERVLLYGAAFALGLWVCLLLGRRMLLSLLPLAVGAGAVAVITLLALWWGDDVGEFLETDATLRYPLGYRNAVAAFFAASVFPTVVLAAAAEHKWWMRGSLVGAATLSIELAVLSQSRSSVFAVIIAIAVLVAAHPARLRILAWLALATAPALLALPWLLDVYQHGGGNTADSLGPLHRACTAMAITSTLSALLACTLARREPAVVLTPAAGRVIGRALIAIVAFGILTVGIAILTAEGGPIGFIDRQTDELTAGSPDLSAQGSRFGFDLRSERGDLWAVALDDLVQAPVTGEGAGGFRFSYLLERDSPLQPEDPHSVEMQMASELGFPGLLLFGAFAVTAVIGILRARRLGPSAAALAAGALAAGAYWLVHASVEWFWTWPGLSLPVIFTLGAASAPALLQPGGWMRPAHRVGLASAAALLAVALLPFLVSERSTKHALSNWQQDLPRAYSDLARAADLNPLSDRPFAAEAVIAEAAGEPQRALAAIAEAQSRKPDEWTLYYLEARILASFDTAGARRALDRAEGLNPNGEEIVALRQSLDESP